MSKPNIDFSFRKTISPVRRASQSVSCLTLAKGLMNSELDFNNTSRFEEKKVLRKLKEQEVINRIESTLQRMTHNDKLAKQALRFKPVPVKKPKREKEN